MKTKINFCDRYLFAINIYYDTYGAMLFNLFNHINVYDFTSMIELSIIALLLVACIPADGRKGPKHARGLPHVCIPL